MKTFVQALVLLGFALPASATDYVKLKDGTPLRGEATSYDEASRMLTF